MRKNTKKRSSLPLKWKLFASFASLAAAILLLLWVLQIWHLDDFYLAITKRNLIAVGEQLYTVEAAELQNEADGVALSNEICVLIFDNSGRKLASSDTSGGCLIHKLGNENLNQLYSAAVKAGGYTVTPIELARLPDGDRGFFDPNAMQGEAEPNATFENSAPVQNDSAIAKKYNLSRLVYSAVITTESGTRFILLDCPLTPVGVVSSTLMVQLAIVSVISALTALIAAFLLSRKISKPIARLSDSASRLANGKYEADFVGGGCREIDELSDSLNYAAVELSKVDKMQKELIANVSHDLRTPLTMITGYAEVMRDLPGENTPENVQVILDETARLTSLVNDIIEISRLQSGKRTLDIQEFSLTDALRDTAERFKKLNECNGYTISCRADDGVKICGDRTAIIQVLYNLIGNAISYTGSDKTVYATLSNDNGMAVVEISDTGKGIPENELEHIWERYYRSQNDHERGVGGSGIGLSIVKELLEAHGADFGVTSALNEGTTFYFALPTV